MSIPAFMVRPPNSETVTEYDRLHFVTYLRLLDATAEGANWEEIASLIFGVDPSLEPDRIKAMFDSHLERARWMARSGYRQIGVQG